jgi:hypothetical protein
VLYGTRNEHWADDLSDSYVLELGEFPYLNSVIESKFHNLGHGGLEIYIYIERESKEKEKVHTYISNLKVKELPPTTATLAHLDTTNLSHFPESFGTCYEVVGPLFPERAPSQAND